MKDSGDRGHGLVITKIGTEGGPRKKAPQTRQAVGCPRRPCDGKEFSKSKWIRNQRYYGASHRQRPEYTVQERDGWASGDPTMVH